MITKRLLCVLLAALTITAAACSSGNSDANNEGGAGDNSEDTTAAETEPVYSFEQKDYDGGTMLFYYPDGSPYGDEFIYSEAQDGEVLNDAVYKRNQDAMDYYNVVFTFDSAGCGTLKDIVKRCIMSNEPIDTVWVGGNGLAALATGNNLVDFNSLNLDMDYPWWNSLANSALSINHRLYMAASDISLKPLEGSYIFYFNQYLVETYNLTDPYTQVRDGTWTFEVMIANSRAVSSDLNGDGSWGVDDRYGVLEPNTADLMIGFDVHFSSKDENDLVSPSLISDRSLTAFSKIYSFLSDYTLINDAPTLSSQISSTKGYNNVWHYTRAVLFTGDHFLYMVSGLDSIEESLRDMEHDFGILPHPKYNDAQDRYFITMDPNEPLMAIPTTNPDTDRTTDVLQYLGYLSSREGSVKEAFYDITLKNKTTRNEEDAAMLDIIRDSMNFEFTYIFDSIDYGSILDESLSDGALASNYAAIEEKVKSKFADFNAQFTSPEV